MAICTPRHDGAACNESFKIRSRALLSYFTSPPKTTKKIINVLEKLMLLLVIKSLNVVGNFRPKDGQHGSTGQKTVHRLPADSNTYGVRNVVLGHYCEHHTMDKLQKLSNPERNMLLSKLTRTKTEQSESKQVNFYFEIPYRKVHFDLLSR